MTDQTPADRFAAALREFESNGDTETISGQFSDGAELFRPEAAKPGSSSDDPAAFWKGYLDQFSEISTEFQRVDESEDHASLEWVSRGKLATGRDIEYRGVSLLTLEDGSISRFATYYDTAAFLEPTT